MKNLNFFKKAFLTVTAVMMTTAFYSCKDKQSENEAVETDMDVIETTEPIETMPADTASIQADTITAPAP